MSKLVPELRRIESTFVHFHHEYNYVFDKLGNILGFARGNSKSAPMPKKIKLNQYVGAVLTHNHPNDSCLSHQDCHVLLTFGLSEIRATTKKGVHVLVNPHPRVVDVDKKKIQYLFRKTTRKKRGAKEGVELVAKDYGLIYMFIPKELSWQSPS